MSIEKTKNKTKEFSCSSCQGTGRAGQTEGTCPNCNGKGFYQKIRGLVLFWGKKQKGIPSVIQKSLEKTAETIEIIIFVLGTLFIFLGAINLWDNLKAHDSILFDLNLFFDIFFAGYATAPLWLGIFLLLVLYFHRFVFRKPNPINAKNPFYRYLLAENPFSQDKKQTPKALDISTSASKNIIKILADSLNLAFRRQQKPELTHLLFALIQKKEIQSVFYKLEIPPLEFIEEALKKSAGFTPENFFLLPKEYKKILLRSFWEAVRNEDETILPEHLLAALVDEKDFKLVLNRFGVTVEDFRNVIFWIKYQKKRTEGFLEEDSFRRPPHRIMNKSWSAVMTKTLDAFSTDITDYARAGLLFPIANRVEEIRSLIQILERRSRNNALLIGEEGSGRETLVRGLAQKVVRGKISGSLFDKRIVKLNLASLGSGLGSDGGLLKNRIEVIMREIIHTQNVILYIPEIHELAKVTSFSSFDILSYLAPLFSQSIIQVIGSTSQEYYHDYLEPRGEFAQMFDIIKIPELSLDASLKAVSLRVPLLERQEGVSISYRAAEEAVKKSARYITDRLLPQKAIDILAEAVVRSKNIKGQGFVTEQEVQEVFSEKTGIPLTAMKENEADELLLLEEKIRKQVIGQERAVSDVSAAIRRARVRIGEIERPIAVFLFVGPTGVGKTELAKALAEIYFGAKEKMIRLDMSEFATPYDIERLLGNTGGSVSGLLTEQVRKSPFSLVLLDEFEKASSNIWDLFLQIFDDGRITDGMGRVVNFTNTIIIATSNVGSRQILENLAQGGSQESIQELVQKELLTVFRPEFINRFDDVVTFNPLSKDNIKEVSLLEIKNLNQRLGEEQGLTVVLAEDALDHLAEIGYSPKFGARFLKRLMREKIEDALVVGILKNQYPRGSVVTITKEQLVK